MLFAALLVAVVASVYLLMRPSRGDEPEAAPVAAAPAPARPGAIPAPPAPLPTPPPEDETQPAAASTEQDPPENRRPDWMPDDPNWRPWEGLDLPPPPDTPSEPAARPEPPMADQASFTSRIEQGITLLDRTRDRLTEALSRAEAAGDDEEAHRLEMRLSRLTEIRAAREADLEAARRGELLPPRVSGVARRAPADGEEGARTP